MPSVPAISEREKQERRTRRAMPLKISFISIILVWRHTTYNLHRVTFAIWALSITFTTMYLRFRYVCDVIVGALVAILVTTFGPRFNDWYLGRHSEESTSDKAFKVLKTKSRAMAQLAMALCLLRSVENRSVRR